ncbi:ABC transporter substrate-binding protein [Paraglaciecola arctica]|uniref:ABC transporter substrate-binding protein n=1 Tax=Paraglaciecola arctica TaxID=1128911 RepID=UPI0020914B01|nr:ABC transporter substrate-binding protein [Paraglaciecola arctica]
MGEKEHNIRILVVALIAVVTFPGFAKQELKIAASISNSSQRAAYYNLARAYEDANPNIQINITSYTSEIYKTKFPQMLVSNQYDILYWHAGERLFEYIEQNKIAAIDHIITTTEMEQLYDQAVIDAVSFKEKSYALPISYYQIGFYYPKPLFSRLKLSEPQSWQQFLEVCEILKKNNVPPIYIGSKSNWPATAWFDYLNLRLNGITFHKELMRGHISYLDVRITNVLKKIQEITTAGYFIENHQDLEWKQGLPLLFRNLIGMSMLGNYAVQGFPETVKNDIGFFKFPVFEGQSTYYEEVPLDVLVMPVTNNKKELTQSFIKFAALSNNQEQFNNNLGIMSPHRGAQQNNSSLAQEAYETIVGAEGITQFFDRDSKKIYGDQIMPLIDAFMVNLNIEYTQKSLEEVRLRILSDESNKHN